MSITKVKRAKRLHLANLQTRIVQENCASCEFNASKYQNSDCEGCHAFKQLTDIGKELLRISAGDKTGKPKRKKSDRVNKSLKDLISLDIYKDYKNQGLPDTKIAEALGVKISSFRKWKKRNELIGK